MCSWRRVAVARVFALVVRCRVMRLLLYSRVGKNRDTRRESPAGAGAGRTADHLTVLFSQKVLAVRSANDIYRPVIQRYFLLLNSDSFSLNFRLIVFEFLLKFNGGFSSRISSSSKLSGCKLLLKWSTVFLAAMRPMRWRLLFCGGYIPNAFNDFCMAISF